MKQNRKLGAIILAAGRGTRMNSQNTNKVAMMLADKPLILRSVNLLEKMDFGQIIVVVGFAKESVKKVLKNTSVIFAQQKKLLGTADAVKSALSKLSPSISEVLVIQGDDSHFYKEEIISKLIDLHYKEKAAITFLTIELKNPFGLGRILRSRDGKVDGIIEEKDATEKTRKITEINPACYIFTVNFLKKYLPKIIMNQITGEYYLTDLIEIAVKNNEKIATLKTADMPWRGVNTKEELEEAEKIFSDLVE
ncbi:MAG TPA: sugar phosphate nucleotidyltransferase [Candidatus Saccharimonadales bacterium]|nr:sugar phosphate nucleotidyltransferase [Candidatus Saccharimonadales bacterium]